MGAKGFLILCGLLCGLGAQASRCAAEEVTEITQYGITWHFTKPAPAGRFITGDWWVIGPVTVDAISPGPAAGEASGNGPQKSNYGAVGMKDDPRMRNGSMIVSAAGVGQGYDSRLVNYDPALSVALSVALPVNVSLISSVSNPDGKVDMLCSSMMWGSEKKGVQALKAAAVLTVLQSEPPADAFRPPYAGRAKRLYRFSQLRQERLLELAPPPAMPDWAQYERYLQRPWLDHVTNWLHQMQGPSENQVNYGREFSRITGNAVLMLNTKAAPEVKRKLLIRMVQLGIDLCGVIDAGRQYSVDGGHYSGRKLPILFAGAMLGDDRMLHPNRLSNFAEDMQTYYGTGWAGQKALYQIAFHTGPQLPYEHLMPEKWGPAAQRAENYRIVNGCAWPAPALAVRLMGLVKEWDHNAWFDYNDRWMTAKDRYAESRKATTDPKQAIRNGNEGKSVDLFVSQMWARYRLSAPHPAWADSDRMWDVSGKGAWVNNPRPALPVEPYEAPAMENEGASGH